MVGWAAAGRRATVEGTSMEPTLRAGDRLLLFPPWKLETGDVVAVRDPRDPRRLLIKRLTAVDRGVVRIQGDNPDSRVFGPVARRSVVGRAVYRYAPSGRVGPIRPGY
jgi:nickel-type superoxide dismutase maturation protease